MSVFVRESETQVSIVTNQGGEEKVLAYYTLADLEALEYLCKFKHPATARLLRGVRPWRAWRQTPETAAVVAAKLQEAGWVGELTL